jgi:hypothetical protein
MEGEGRGTITGRSILCLIPDFLCAESTAQAILLRIHSWGNIKCHLWNESWIRGVLEFLV